MVLPVIQHRLTKINNRTRRFFIRTALCCSAFGCIGNFVSAFTNHWLYTSEVLRYFVHPNITSHMDDITSPRFFKNATLGPWLFCWLDPLTPFHCNKVDLFSQEEPSDVTSSIEYSVRPSFLFAFGGCVLDFLGLAGVIVCLLRPKPYRSLFISTILHIFAGLADFNSIIVYMSGVSKEVGSKIFPASEMDDPLFYYSYGFSFVVFKISFLCTETAAFFLVLVYMSKRDERTYNRYCINTIMRNLRDGPDPNTDTMILNNRYHQHARINALQRASRVWIIPESPHCSLWKPGDHSNVGAPEEGPFDELPIIHSYFPRVHIMKETFEVKTNTSNRKTSHRKRLSLSYHFKRMAAAEINTETSSNGLIAHWNANSFILRRKSKWLPVCGLIAKVRIRYATMYMTSEIPKTSVQIPLISITYIEDEDSVLHIRGCRFRLQMSIKEANIVEIRDSLRFFVIRQRIPHSVLGLPFDWEIDKGKRSEPKVKFLLKWHNIKFNRK